MEEMTWMEIRQRITGGAHVVIVPTGGTEQNGPHMVTGKHNIIVHYTAGEIAKRLGDALVAPVLPFSPSGRISPPEGHMQFPGTISLGEKAFAAVLEDEARSLKQNGFRLICFIGDHGGSQRVQKQVAEKLTDEWFSDGIIVLQVDDYYANNGQEAWGNKTGLKVSDPGAHAGHIDTSEVLALDPRGVRDTLRAARSERDYRATGAMGDSSQATANYGRKYLGLKIEAAVKQIKNVDSPLP
jgi:creatinine amidohydrolase/Fe(II)-dependent formamide hydrolase-like protein